MQNNRKYLVRIIIEEVEIINETVEQYLGEVHGEDLMTFDTLDAARQGVDNYSSIIASYVSAENSITDDLDAGHYGDPGEWLVCR